MGITVRTVASAIAGGVIGNRTARGLSETLGTILGAGAGALASQAVDRRTRRFGPTSVGLQLELTKGFGQSTASTVRFLTSQASLERFSISLDHSRTM